MIAKAIIWFPHAHMCIYTCKHSSAHTNTHTHPMSVGTAQVACGKYKLVHKQNNKLFYSNMLFPKPHIFAYFLFIFYVVFFSLILSFHNKTIVTPPHLHQGLQDVSPGKGACCTVWQSVLIPGTHVAEKKNQLPKIILLSLHICYALNILLYSYTYEQASVKYFMYVSHAK